MVSVIKQKEELSWDSSVAISWPRVSTEESSQKVADVLKKTNFPKCVWLFDKVHDEKLKNVLKENDLLNIENNSLPFNEFIKILESRICKPDDSWYLKFLDFLISKLKNWLNIEEVLKYIDLTDKLIYQEYEWDIIEKVTPNFELSDYILWYFKKEKFSGFKVIKIMKKLRKTFNVVKLLTELSGKKFKLLLFEWNWIYNLSKWDYIHENGNFFDELLWRMEKQPNKEMYSVLNDMIDEIFPKLTQDSIKYNEQEIEENQKRILNFQKELITQEDKNISVKLGLKENELDISVYTRCYGGTGYEEIWEVIILFLEKYIKNRFSKYFKKIRIIPRKYWRFPNDNILNSELITKYNVMNPEFTRALHTYAVAWHTEYWKDNDNVIPSIITPKMETSQKNKFGDSVSKLDLDWERATDFTKIATLEELLKEILRNIMQLENMLDRVWVE